MSLKGLTFCAILLLIIAALCASAAIASEHSTRISLKLQSSAGTDLEREQLQHLIDRVLSRSGATVVALSSGAVVRDYDLPEAVHAGAVDAAFYTNGDPRRLESLRHLPVSATICGLTRVERSPLPFGMLSGGEIVPSFRVPERPSSRESVEVRPIMLLVNKERWSRYSSELRTVIEQACKENVERAGKKGN